MARILLVTGFFLVQVFLSSVAQAWRLTEKEPDLWAQDSAAVHPADLMGWQEYSARKVPIMGINKTVWLKQIIPPISDSQGLFFENGLEDLAVYVDDTLIYSYGSFSRRWQDGSSQRWHFIPLRADQAGKTLYIRTHYMIGYMTRTLYPTIEAATTVYPRQISQSLPLTLVAGAFGALGILCLAIAGQRRMLDIFFHFGLLTLCTCSWVLFNQDSMTKQFTMAPERSWPYLDVIALLIAIPNLFAFLNGILYKSSNLIRYANYCLIGITTLAVFGWLLDLLQPWYLLPIMQVIALPTVVVTAPRMIFDSVRQNPEARDLSFGVLMVLISGVHDSIRYTGYLNSPFHQMIPLGVTFMFGAMVRVLIRRYRREMESHLHVVEAMVEEKTREIRSIFSNIQQGIFMVEGSNLVLNREYSKHLETLLEEKDMGGQAFSSCFLDKTEIGADHRQGLLSILQLSLGEDEAAFDLNADNLPLEIRLHNRILELTWAPIVDAQGRTEKILVTARDVTNLRELQSAAQRSQEEMQLIQVILAQKPERFARFLKASSRLLEQIGPTIENSSKALAEDTQILFRNLHTLKGNSRTFGLEGLADLVHRAEQELLSASWESLRSSGKAIEILLEQYEYILHNRLGWNQSSDQIMLDRSLLEQFILRTSSRESLEALLLPLVFVPAELFFFETFNSLHRVAEDLGKERPRLSLSGFGYFFPKTTEEVLTHCFGHIFRNAIDHGLEPASIRIQNGKAPVGTIRIDLQEEQETLYIRCQDDGRGIQPDRIRERALSRGLITETEELNDKRMEDILFAGGFSIKAQASMVSGRGIGLDAVRAFLQKLGGQIQLLVRSKDARTGVWQIAFELQLPPGTFLRQSQGTTVESKAS